MRPLLVAIELLLLALALSSVKALLPAEKPAIAQPAGWTQFTFLVLYVSKLWAHPGDPQRLFLINYRTPDGGRTWTLYPFYTLYSIAFAPNGVLYATAAAPDGFYRSADGGATWTLVPPTQDSPSPPIDDMVVDPRDPDVIYGADRGLGIGARKSTDGGRTWRAVNRGLGPSGLVYSDVRNMVIDPQTPDILYATNANVSGVYKTTNGGEQWFQVGFNIGTDDLAIDPANPSVLFVTGERGTWRTRDGGATWTLVGPGASVIIFNPLNSSHIYLSSDYVGSSTTPVRRSLDGGDNWEDFSAGLVGLVPTLSVHSLAFRMANPPELWAGTNYGLYKYVFPALNLQYRLYFPTLGKGSTGP